jgi:hypothetical protein
MAIDERRTFKLAPPISALYRLMPRSLLSMKATK